jgi:protein-tyrosine-phosphatase
MAEYFFKELIHKVRPEEEQFWQVQSAGTWTENGFPATSGTKKTMAALGLDLSGHRSQAITQELLGNFNLLLVMEYGHQESIRIEFPQYREKLFLLSAMAGGNYEIVDPMGGTEADYTATALQIRSILEQGQELIFRLAGKKAS